MTLQLDDATKVVAISIGCRNYDTFQFRKFGSVIERRLRVYLSILNPQLMVNQLLDAKYINGVDLLAYAYRTWCLGIHWYCVPYSNVLLTSFSSFPCLPSLLVCYPQSQHSPKNGCRY